MVTPGASGLDAAQRQVDSVTAGTDYIRVNPRAQPKSRLGEKTIQISKEVLTPYRLKFSGDDFNQAPTSCSETRTEVLKAGDAFFYFFDNSIRSRFTLLELETDFEEKNSNADFLFQIRFISNFYGVIKKSNRKKRKLRSKKGKEKTKLEKD